MNALTGRTAITIERVYTPGLAQVAYIVADEDAGVAVVIDPRRDVDEYLAWLNERRLELTAILETHVHADFVSGARELAAATGATIYASRLGNLDFPHAALVDGDEVAVGRFRLQAFWTPGHTPEHMSFLLIDPAQGNEPAALFSGDLLFVGEVGRPDLLGSEHTRALAEQLHDTLAHRLAPLHDGVVVYPGHTAGSSCGKKIGDAPQTTIGQERRSNYALRPETLASRERFIETIMSGMPVPPAYYPTMKRVNKAGPPLVGSLPSGQPLTADEVARKADGGALIVDARSVDAYLRGHIPGSFFVGDDPERVNWIGWLAPYGRELILVLDDDARFAQARTELRRIGLDAIAGYLRGGVERWGRSGRDLATTAVISPEGLRERLTSGDRLIVLDVRTAEEWRSGHVPGAANRFVGEIAMGAEFPVAIGTELAIICATGRRSTVAASLLEARQCRGLLQVTGGTDAWRAAGFEVEES